MLQEKFVSLRIRSITRRTYEWTKKNFIFTWFSWEQQTARLKLPPLGHDLLRLHIFLLVVLPLPPSSRNPSTSQPDTCCWSPVTGVFGSFTSRDRLVLQTMLCITHIKSRSSTQVTGVRTVTRRQMQEDTVLKAVRVQLHHLGSFSVSCLDHVAAECQESREILVLSFERTNEQFVVKSLT